MIFLFELALVVSALHYYFFLFGVYKGLKKIMKQKLNDSNNRQFISVIIPFRNEEKNLETSLNSMNAQTYPKELYEVIYVNDDSDDLSVKTIEDHDYKHNVILLHLNQSGMNRGFKKNAIEKAIDIARGEIIVTTDADCVHHPDWLLHLSKNFDENTGFISMPVIFLEGESLFNRMQSIEFAGLVLTGAGLIGKRAPAICNGANIAYRKSIFKKVNGYDDNKNLSSGDDEFLMQKIFKDTDAEIKFLIGEEFAVRTHANDSIRKFFTQRKRWASKGFYYKNKFFVARLLLIFLFFFTYSVTLLLSLLNPLYFFLFLLLFLLKSIFEFQIINEGIGLLLSQFKLRHFLLAELLHPFYIVLMSIAGTFGGFVWKDRKLKR